MMCPVSVQDDAQNEYGYNNYPPTVLIAQGIRILNKTVCCFESCLMVIYQRACKT